MSKTLLIALLVLGTFSISGAQGWQQLTVPTVTNVNDIYFGDTQNGWAGSDQGILRTTDGGDNWTITLTVDDVNGIHFNDLSNGWACGNDGFLRHTDNGGVTWMTQNSGAFDKLRDIFMADGSVGWIVGRNAILRKTSNGGLSWFQQPNPAFDDLHKVVAVDPNTAWVVGKDGFILFTSNGGTNWTAQPSGSNETFESVFFHDSQNGWACGDLGMLRKTTDGGASWIPQPTQTSATINDITFVDMNNGWFVTQSGEIFRTTDGGVSWTMSEDFFSALFAVTFVNPDYGFVSGATGFVAKYTAATGIEDETSSLPKSLAINQNYPNPFNASTTITYTLDRSLDVKVEIFDLLGRNIESLFEGNLPAGNHQVTWNADNYPSGTYLYRISAGADSETRKMVLLK